MKIELRDKKFLKWFSIISLILCSVFCLSIGIRYLLISKVDPYFATLQVRQQVYTDYKDSIKESLQSNIANTRSEQEKMQIELLQKDFFEDFYKLLDKNANDTELMDYIQSKMGVLLNIAMMDTTDQAESDESISSRVVVEKWGFLKLGVRLYFTQAESKDFQAAMLGSGGVLTICAALVAAFPPIAIIYVVLAVYCYTISGLLGIYTTSKGAIVEFYALVLTGVRGR